MRSQYLIPIAFFGGALLANTLQIRAYLRHRAIKKRGVQTTAKITAHGYIHEEIEGQEYLQTSKMRRVTTIQFEANGQTLSFEEDIGRDADIYQAGQSVPLWYMEGDPTQHVLGKGKTWKGVLAVFAVSLPFWLMGLWVALGSPAVE